MNLHPDPHDASPAPWTAYACLAGSMALVGLYVGLSPLLVAVFPVLLLAWLRFALAAVAMASWLKRHPAEAPLDRRGHALLFLQSFLGNFLFTLCALNGTYWAGALSAGVTMAAIPAVVALMSWLFLSERLTRRMAVAVALSVLAVALLALARQGSESGESEARATGSVWLGQLLLLAAVVCEAAYVVIGKRLSARVSPKRVSAIINLWGLALATPWGLALALEYDFSAVQPGSWLLLVFYAVSASMVTVWLWMQGLQRVAAQQAGVFTVFLPLSSAAVGVGILGEEWGPLHAIALLLAVVAVFLVTRSGSRAVDPAQASGS